MINPNFVYVGLFLVVIGHIDYLIDTVKGKVKPNRVTWLLWAATPLISFYAQIKQGVGMEAFAVFIVGFMPLLILISSFVSKKAEWEIKKLDIACGALSFLGLILWMVTKEGNLAIFFSILADGLAAVPTIVKSWHDPETESFLVYLMSFINAAIGLLIVRTWHFENYSFLVYIFIVDLLLTVLIRFKIGKMLQ